MDATFPWGLPADAAFYLALYIITLVLHVFPMTYILAGSAVLFWAAAFPGSGPLPRPKQPLLLMLRDWSPFVLSGAITAAVAPLLFVQILYPRHFYTANLLLGARWMIVIPALILAFYLLYLIKAKAVSRWPAAGRIAVTLVAALCFLFVAFCWTANHLLSITPDAWPDAYITGNVIRSYVALGARLATWFAGAFPTMCILAAWQLVYYKPTNQEEDDAHAREPRRLALLSLAGLAAALLFAAIYFALIGADARVAILGPAGRVWIFLLLLGIGAQGAGWLLQRRRDDFKKLYLAVISAGGAITLLAAASLRELIRLSQVDLTLVAANAAEAVKIQGFVLFLLFSLLNLGLIGLSIWLVMRSRRDEEEAPQEKSGPTAQN